MKILENTLAEPLAAVLDRPLFCFLATTDDGRPRVSPLWYHWAPADGPDDGDAPDGTLWILGDAEKTYTTRVRETDRVAVAVVDFDPAAGRVVHVGLRGTASVEPHDPAIAERLLARYLGSDPEDWDPRFRDLSPDRWPLVRAEPDTAVCRDQSYAPGDPATGSR